MPNPSDIRRILSIGRATSVRGEGVSLRDAVRRARYKELRGAIDSADLVAAMRDQYVDDWTKYCEDKRTSGGWVLVPETKEIWLFANPDKRYAFDTIEEAVANYVIAELDYWCE